ncbi:MAG: hypothetical protein ABSE05_15335 [Syntrophales bacterium]
MDQLQGLRIRGDLLRLKFSLQDEVNFNIVEGKVVWVEEFSVNDYKAYDCGIEFIVKIKKTSAAT